jgi:hypothetical protein
MADHTAADAQMGISIKLSEALRKVICIEGHVAIQFYEELPIVSSDPIVTVIKRINDPVAWFSAPAIRPVDSHNPGLSRCPMINNCTRLIRGTIVHQNPLSRSYRLRDHTLNGPFEVLRLVTHGADHHVLDRP